QPPLYTLLPYTTLFRSLTDDADFEHDQVLSEKMEATLLASIQQAGQTGALAPDDLAFISEQVQTGKVTLFEAVQKAQTRAQTRQDRKSTRLNSSHVSNS